MIEKFINKITESEDLTFEEAQNLIVKLASGDTSEEQIAQLLVALNKKGETTQEISGFASKMREMALAVDLSEFKNVVDSCGTGGDCTNTFNISTTAAILTASSGLKVAKHSNFGFTSKSGSSNVVEALGITLAKNPQELVNYLREKDITFIHSPYFHQSTKHVNPVRKKLGIRTVFNFLGPLVNPAKPTGQVLGVSDPQMAPKIVETLKNLGCKKALVVCGKDPVIDELSVCGETLVWRLENEIIEHFTVKPEDFGLKRAKIEDLAGGTPEQNARLIKDIFSGKESGAKLDAVLLNCAAMLWAGNEANSIEEGIKIAQNLIVEGRAERKLLDL